MFPISIILKNEANALLREAQLSDASDMIAYTHLVAGESDFLSFGEGDWNIGLEEEQRIIIEHQERLNQIFLLVIYQNEIAAMLNVVAPNRVRKQHFVEFGVSVRQPFWGLDIGTQLIQAMLDWCTMNPIIKKINLRVSANNSTAIRLYEKLGFKYEGLIRHEMCIRGEMIDSYWMGQILD